MAPMMPKRRPPPLDQPKLERLALRYVERFATSRGKLVDYLTRKVRERGWDGAAPADPQAIAARMAELNYIDDRGYAEGRARSLARRGMGVRRIEGAWRAAGIGEADTAALRPDVIDGAEASALAYARRRRIGPYAPPGPRDRAVEARALAAMLRAGHDYDLARRILAIDPNMVDDFETDTFSRPI